MRLAHTSGFLGNALSVITLGLATLIIGLPSRASDWPTYRRDNRRTGSTPDELPTTLVPRWVYKPPAAPRQAWSGPNRRTFEGKLLRHRVRFDDAFQVAIVDGRVYFGSSADHQVHCCDLATGQELWHFFTGGPVRLAPTVWQQRVLFGSDDGRVYCLDAGTGKRIWSLRAGSSEEWLLARGEMVSRWPVRTGVLVEDGIAYFGAGIFPYENILLYAVDAADGKVLWKRDNISQTSAGRDDLTPQGYLLTEGELLFAPSGRTLPAAIERQTGKIVHKREHAWRTTAGGVVGGAKALLADGQIYASGDHHFLAMDQKSGDVGFGWFDGEQIAVAGEAAYVLTGSQLRRLDRLPYAQASRKRHELEMEVYTLGRKLRGKNADKYRKRIAQARKEIDVTRRIGLHWQIECPADSAIMVAGKNVVVGGKDRVMVYAAEDGKQAWQAATDGETRGLAVADGHLVASTTSGVIHCFAAPSSATQSKQATSKPISPFPQDRWTAVYESAAKQILDKSGVRRGFCLILGNEQGRLACELAKRSELKIYAIEADGAKCQAARQKLADAGLYGSRITVHQADPAAIPYSNYFANLIVSDSLLVRGQVPAKAAKVARHLKPVGGVVCLGRPDGTPDSAGDPGRLGEWLNAMDLGDEGEIETDGAWALLRRGKLPGAGSWSHQYADSGNTACSQDTRIGGGLGVLWYGDPGPGEMVNRHDGAVGPLALGGRLFVQGENCVMAYDAYNGLFLWRRENPDAIRTGVFQNQNPGNLAASDDSLFLMIRDICYQLSPDTGAVQAEHSLPKAVDPKTHDWGYVAYRDGLLFGTATRRQDLDVRLRRRGRVTDDATDSIFAIDVETGEHLWSYAGKSISHHTIALGPDRVFFIDSTVTAEQRAEILAQDKSKLKRLTGEAARRAEERLKKQDLRLAVALDAKTGKKAWARPVDVTDCSEIGIGGGKLTLMLRDNVLILGGANANGHYWRQFLNGEFSRRRLVALSAADGYKLWAKDANYRHRPIIVGSQVIAEPWSFDLLTGDQRMRANPLTGQDEPWSMVRPGHHCGMITGSPNMLFFRSKFTAFYDLQADVGTGHFAGHRLGCWINAIPANGLVIIPEASAGCVCLFSIASTVVLEPRQARQPWAIFSSTGRKTPVRHMALNLGAPGDRRDARGQAWLACPRPVPGKQTGLDLALDVTSTFSAGGGYESVNDQARQIAGADASWLYTSWARGLTSVSIPLLGDGDAPATYTVKLHFADPDGAAPGKRVFDVRAQGATVIKDLDVADQAKEPGAALVREIPGVRVSDKLLLELVPSKGGTAADEVPVLSAIEIERSDLGS